MRRIGVLVATVTVLAGCESSASPPRATQASMSGLRSAPPAVGATWQYQLQGTVDTSIDARVFDIDGFTTSAATVGALHVQSRHVICYLDGGSWEDFRPDASAFPETILGKPYQGYANERWLDIRDHTVLPGLLRSRLQSQCAKKGFDGVEWDNVEGFANDTGFPLTAEDQRRFNTWLARITHEAGLRVALKNDRDQVDALVSGFDYAVDEECLQYGECGKLQPYVAAGKPVFDVEYVAAAFKCPGPPGVSVILKDKGLDAKPRRSC